jgi:aryl-alcohol dehydrogenase-like predicted oxidoreductase
MAVRPEGQEHLLDDEATFAAVDAFAAEARRRGVDPPALALAWLLCDERVTAVILGARRPEHLEPARAALELELTPAERDELAELFPE